MVIAGLQRETTGNRLEPVEVRSVEGRRERDEFVRLPWTIYEHDPVWVPPLVYERKEFIHPRKHPFYRHGSAALFLARREGEVVGRIMASEDPRFNELHGTRTGCFGLFESIDDPLVAHALLDAAADWLTSRGLSHVIGPVDYSTNYSCGLLVDGFQTPPRVLMNHNPPYYQALLESWGLAKAKDLYSWWFVDQIDLEQNWQRLAEHLRRRGKVDVRPIRMDDLDREIEACERIYNDAWSDNWGFVPMTKAEFDFLAKSLRSHVPAEYVLMAEVEGRIVGFAMSLPDFNEAMRPLDGRLFSWGLPVGLWRFHRNRKKVRHSRLVTLGVLSEFRRRGVAELLILNTLEQGKKMGLVGAELGWTLEDNELINRAIRSSGAELYKTYRIYEKSLVTS